MYGCQTWLLKLRKEHRLRAFRNRVLRKVFRPKRDEVTGEWRRLLIEKLNYLYCSPNIVRLIKLIRKIRAGHVARIGERRGEYTVLVGRHGGNRPLERPKCRLDDNIKM